jgi:hypothetical protein
MPDFLTWLNFVSFVDEFFLVSKVLMVRYA